MCGFVFSFGYEIDFPNENVLGYCKQIKMDYTKYGFELGKLYYTSKRGKLHTFSIAPTYTKVYYRQTMITMKGKCFIKALKKHQMERLAELV